MVDLFQLLQNPELSGKLNFSLKGDDLLCFANKYAEQKKDKEPPIPVSEPDVLFTIDETADFLKVSRVTLWQWEKKKILVPQKIGNISRYRRSDIMAALERRAQK